MTEQDTPDRLVRQDRKVDRRTTVKITDVWTPGTKRTALPSTPIAKADEAKKR
jgi:hypothetical protein